MDLSPQTWQRIMDVFDDVVPMSCADREAAVERRCGDDRQLHDYLLALLAAYDRFGARPDSAGSPRLPPAADLQPGEILADRFEIVRFVAHGGMGTVYEAYDRRLREKIALKTLRSDRFENQGQLEGLRRETRLARRVTHRSVCRVFDLETASTSHGELTFVTMEFLEGETLAARLARTSRLEPAEACHIGRQIAAALEAAHAEGVIHRDLKSGNVFLVADPVPSGRVVVTDFGIACLVRGTSTGSLGIQRGQLVGTPRYMAPELWNGADPTFASDLYALGVILYEALAGRDPEAFSSAGPRWHAPALNRRWNAAIARCLAVDPRERPSSAGEFLRLVGPRFRPTTTAIGATAAAAALVTAFLVIPRATPRSLAVLPLECTVASDENDEAFCRGVSSLITARLQQSEEVQGALWVVPPGDVRDSEARSPRAARRRLGVDFVVTGEMMVDADTVRVTANLVDAKRDQTIRRFSRDFPRQDRSTFETDLMREIVDLVDLEWRPEMVAAEDAIPSLNARDFYIRGAGYLEQGAGSADAAIGLFTEAVRLDPQYAAAFAGLAEARLSKWAATRDAPRLLDAAHQDCGRALALNGRLAAAHVVLGKILEAKGRHEEALAALADAVKIDERHAAAYMYMGVIHEALGHVDRAERMYRRAISLRPGYWVGYANLGIFYYGRGRFRDAEDMFEKERALAPDNPNAYESLGALYARIGNYAKAEAVLLESIRLKPSAPAYNNLGAVYFYQRRFSDSVPIMEKGVQLSPGSPELRTGLGNAYRWAGRAEEASRAYAEALRLLDEQVAINPRNADLRSWRAVTLGIVGRHGEALDEARQAADLTSTQDVLFNCAWAAEISGQRDRALEFITALVGLGAKMTELAAYPDLDRLREDRRFAALVAN